jgi:hypothetical protein
VRMKKEGLEEMGETGRERELDGRKRAGKN